MLLEHIERLREKPYAARKRIAFFCALGITAVIAGVWLISVPSRLSSLKLSPSDQMGGADAEVFTSKVQEAQNGLQNFIETGKQIQAALPQNAEYPTDLSASAAGSIENGSRGSDGAESEASTPVLIETASTQGVKSAPANAILIATSSSEQTP